MVVFLCFSLILRVNINFHEYANKIICIFDHGIKDLYLSFKNGAKFRSL